MAQARFVHIGFGFTGEPPVAALEKLFSGAIDWMRYDQRCWILYTTTELDTWRDRIRNTPGVLSSDSFFLCEFTPTSYSGYLYDWVWKWIKKHSST